ncbi:MAG: O-antigen ligase family protein [Prosthecobacter sp.]|jgi:hypothetical protein|uniref:O-antigen ligase family protein n=1 Tax=Prosthecobacter sp. TaxID=1965333 RepID=UPI0019E2B8E7|nr:O-antigen ligase family protein [Prosthecobacter sp.]MBE2286968.1 O-antigen ligase family protein [Prosthecobacter sp.]
MKPDLEPQDSQTRAPLLVGDEYAADSGPVLLPGSGDEAPPAGEDDVEDSQREESSYDLPGPAWKGMWFAVVPLLMCLAGSGPEAWSKGFGAVLLGVTMLVFPLQRQLPRLARGGILAALLAPLTAFLPASWFPLPEWRTLLVNDWDLAFSDTLTPQFHVSLEGWVFMAVCGVWLVWCLARGFSSDQRRSMVQVLSIGGSILCLLSLLEYWGAVSIPWWPRSPSWGAGFGPFANRNHISSLAAITAVLCATCAYDSHKRKSRAWSLFVLGVMPPLTLIFVNTSRAGLILFFVGITAWLGTSAMGRGFFKKMTVTTSLVLLISALLVLSSGGLTARLNDTGVDGFASSEGRVKIYLQTLEMSLSAPWLGFGLNNFAGVFAQFSQVYNLRERPVHPESDLLWLLVDGGLLTVIPVVLVALWWFNSTGPWFGRKRKQRSRQNDRRLRNGTAIACGLGMLHGVFDVPNHGQTYFAFMALLAGIALRPRRLPLPATLVSAGLLRFAAVGVVVAGGLWLAASQGKNVPLGTSRAQFLTHQAGQLADDGASSQSLALFSEAIRMAPMQHRLYFARAQIRLRLNGSSSDVLADFSRARALEPNDTDMCYREGLLWLNHRPEFAIIPWREIVIRAPGYYYPTLIQQSLNHPRLKEQLWDLATTAELKLTYLDGVNTREEFDRCLRSLLALQPDLSGLEASQRERIFRQWYQMGDQKALLSALETNRKWRDVGWRILAGHYASNSDFKRACETVVPYLPSIVRTAPGTSTDIPTLERALLYSPTDARRGIDLFQAQKTQGDIDGALRTLEKVATLPNAPPYVHQEVAALYVLKQDFRRAWEHLREAMEKR